MRKLPFLLILLSMLAAAQVATAQKVAQVESEFVNDEDEEDDGSALPNRPARDEVDEEMQTSDPIEQTDALPKKAETVTPAPNVQPRVQPRVQPKAQPKFEASTPATPIRREEMPLAKPGDSEKIFDWSKHQGERNVKHPFAEKGLMRITKDRDYLYNVNPSPQNHAGSFRLGFFQPLNLANPDGGPNSAFEDNYDETSNPMIMFDYEWQLWRTAIGKFGVRAGSGIYLAQGNGHFETPSSLTPKEILTFWMTPHQLGVVYRMQFWDRQLIVPYAEGGGYAITFGEFRDDGKPPKWGGALAAYFALGGAFNMSYFDKLAAIAMDREYGINRIYFTAEYRPIIGLTRYDFTADLINVGFLGEF